MCLQSEPSSSRPQRDMNAHCSLHYPTSQAPPGCCGVAAWLSMAEQFHKFLSSSKAGNPRFCLAHSTTRTAKASRSCHLRVSCFRQEDTIAAAQQQLQQGRVIQAAPVHPIDHIPGHPDAPPSMQASLTLVPKSTNPAALAKQVNQDPFSGFFIKCRLAW
jgi:hypothetical protein